jgi:hypothetical protein
MRKNGNSERVERRKEDIGKGGWRGKEKEIKEGEGAWEGRGGKGGLSYHNDKKHTSSHPPIIEALVLGLYVDCN